MPHLSIAFRFTSIVCLFALVSCRAPSFYEKTYNFNRTISTGDFEEAERLILDNQEKYEKSKVRFLFFVNAGMVEHLKGDFEKSNEWFEKADIFVEDSKKKVGEETAALLLNPNISTYYGEDHEVLLINYFKALNYYLLGELDEALVEARRLNLSLQELSDKYTSEEKYSEDAFMHVLMGMIYEANGEHNDAFIAYRNGFNIYEGNFQDMIGVGAPDQLKKDLIRSAARSGMREELLAYEKQFGITYDGKASESSVLVLWNNGMGPVKEEWGINFAIIYTGGGWVTFVNDKYGFSFPFYVGNTDLAGLTWIKVVFPRYVKRDMIFSSSTINANGQTYDLELAEDLNAVSFKVLEERMLLEFSKSLLRVALKQVAAHEIGKSQDSPALGAALSIVASASESADTRNWNTIPHSIYYTRVPVEPGKSTIDITLKGANVQNQTHTLEVDVNEGQTKIFPFYSLGSYDPVTLNRAKQ